jgi:predicted nucleic-acid-binding protein
VIALDTNVLVRFLVEDDAEQTARARTLLQRAVDEQSVCYVPEIVLCELVWVLSSAYRISRAEIALHLGSLLRARSLAFRSTDLVARALAAFREGRGDFSGYLIREESRASGCDVVVTFDKTLHGDDGFKAV